MAKKYETLNITHMDAREAAAELLRIAEIAPDARIGGGDDGLGGGEAWIEWTREMTPEEEAYEAELRKGARKVLAEWETDFLNAYIGAESQPNHR